MEEGRKKIGECITKGKGSIWLQAYYSHILWGGKKVDLYYLTFVDCFVNNKIVDSKGKKEN